MTVVRRRFELVRYHSPFGSPVWLDRRAAEAIENQDKKVYAREKDVGGLSKRQLEHGPPRIEKS